MSSGMVLSELQESRNKPSEIIFVHTLSHTFSLAKIVTWPRGQRSKVNLPRPCIEFIFSKLSSSALYIWPQEASSGSSGFVGLFKQFGSISTPKSPSEIYIKISKFYNYLLYLPVMKNIILVSPLLLFSRAMWSESVFNAANVFEPG